MWIYRQISRSHGSTQENGLSTCTAENDQMSNTLCEMKQNKDYSRSYYREKLRAGGIPEEEGFPGLTNLALP